MEREKITGEVFIEQLKVKNIFEFAERFKAVSGGSATEIVEVILASAISLEASDIHIEPFAELLAGKEEEKAKIRIRIDGILHDVIIFDFKIYKLLLSRIKLLSGIKLNITNKPQDGRFTISSSGTLIEIRASTLPSEHGETIVLRI